MLVLPRRVKPCLRDFWPESQNTKRTYCKPNEQLSPERWPLSCLNLTKYNIDTQKVKTVQTATKTIKHREPNQKYRLGTVSNIKFYWRGLNRFDRRPFWSGSEYLVSWNVPSAWWNSNWSIYHHGKTNTSRKVPRRNQVKKVSSLAAWQNEFDKLAAQPYGWWWN